MVSLLVGSLSRHRPARRVHRALLALFCCALLGSMLASARGTLAQASNIALNRSRHHILKRERLGAFPPSAAVDGSATTRWASTFSDPQWIRVDLGSVQNIGRVVLRWEAAYGRAYQIQVSNDDSSWSSIFSTTTGDGGVDDLTGLSGSGRYLRMNGTQRATAYGYSLFELEVYNGAIGPTATATRTATATSTATRTPTPARLRRANNRAQSPRHRLFHRERRYAALSRLRRQPRHALVQRLQRSTVDPGRPGRVAAALQGGAALGSRLWPSLPDPGLERRKQLGHYLQYHHRRWRRRRPDRQRQRALCADEWHPARHRLWLLALGVRGL